jgi:hypothetical protein
MLDMCGADTFLRLAEQPDINIFYLDGGSGVLTEAPGSATEEHRPTLYRLPSWELEGFATRELQRATGRSGKGRRLAHRLLTNIKPLNIDDQVVQEAVGDYQDGATAERVAHRLIDVLAPTYRIPDDFFFAISKKRTDERGDWFVVESNVDWGAATRAWQEQYSHQNVLNPAFVLTNTLKVQENLYFASLFSSDIAVDALQSKLIEDRCRALLQARRRHTEIVGDFQHNVLGSSRALAEAINSGERSISELLDLLPHARHFRAWVNGHDPDESLLQKYISEVVARTWVERLPAKTARWALVTAAGALGGLLAGEAGLAISAAAGYVDSILIERMLAGWKPNRFIDDRLRPFIRDV